MHRVAEENRARHREVVKSDISSAEKIRRRVNDYLITIESNPFFHELLVELIWLNRGKKSMALYEEITTEPFTELQDILKDADPPFPVDSRLPHMAILAMCEYTVQGKPLIDALVGDSSSKEFRIRYRQFVSDLIINGLRISE